MGHVIRQQRGDRAAALAELAAAQLGLVRVDQLRTIGLSADTARSRHARFRFHRVHRGIYLVGHADLTPPTELLAAAFAGGPEAAIANESAAYALGLLPRPRGPIDTAVPQGRRCRPGVRMHRVRLAEADVGHIGLIPLTSPLRTLIDLAAATDGATLERALDEARIRRLVRERNLEGLATRFRGHHGLRPLGALLAGQAGPDFSRSEAERRLLRIVREAGFPRPRRNVRVAGWEVDLVWPDHGLVVELDGYRFHAGRGAFERDRRKTAELEDAGYSVLRLTWRQISEQELRVVARIAERLRRGRAAAAPPPAPRPAR